MTLKKKSDTYITMIHTSLIQCNDATIGGNVNFENASSVMMKKVNFIFGHLNKIRWVKWKISVTIGQSNTSRFSSNLQKKLLYKMCFEIILKLVKKTLL